MGWDGYKLYGRPKAVVVAEFLKAEFGDRIVASSKYGSREVYVAARASDNPGIVRGYVVLAEVNDGHVLFKVISEVEGPYYLNASAKVLAALSPIEAEWALKWRAGCRRAAAERAARNKLKVFGNDVVVFADPVKLSSGEVVKFARSVVGRNLFESARGSAFRYLGWKNNVKEVIKYPGSYEALSALLKKLALRSAVSGSGNPIIEEKAS